IRHDGQHQTRWMFDSDDLYMPTARGAGWVHAAGGNYFDLAENPDVFIGNQPEAVAGLQFMQDLIWEHQLMAPLDIRGQARWWNENSAIMMWLGSADLGRFEQNVTAFEWDLAPRPMGPASRGYI